MKKLVIAIATVIAAAAMASSATATGPVYEDSGFLCGLVTPDGFAFTYDSSFVVYARAIRLKTSRRIRGGEESLAFFAAR